MTAEIKLKRITPQDTVGWKPFYDVFEKTHKYPRFYQSPLYLLQGGATFLWTVHDECLIIVKRRQYQSKNARALALMLAPIHAEGDRDKEHVVMDHFLSLGFSVHISGEDCTRYGLDNKLDSIYGPEIIYRAGDMVEMSGSKFTRDRQYARKLDASVSSGEIAIEKVYRPSGIITQRMMDQCRSIAMGWRRNKKGQGVTVGVPESYSKHFPNLLGENLLHIFSRKGTPCAYTMGERVASNRAVLSVRHHSADLAHLLFGQVSRVVHIADLRVWTDVLGPESLLSIGVGKIGINLTSAKRELHPVYELPMGKIKEAPISDEIWEATRPEQVSIQPKGFGF